MRMRGRRGSMSGRLLGEESEYILDEWRVYGYNTSYAVTGPKNM